MEIVTYPDPVLEAEGAPVTTFDDALKERTREMFELMYAARGVGLAAPQIGWSARLFVVNPTAGEDRTLEQVFVNPEIVSKTGRELGEEGCLSFPGVTVHVPRATQVVMRAQDVDGHWFTVETDHAFLSRILQHEYDHIVGILFITKMTPADRIAVDKKLKEMRATKAGE